MPSDSTLLISQEASFKKYYLAVFGVNLVGLSLGTVFGYSSPALFSLNHTASRLHLTPYQQSWFGSMIALAALIGSLISGKTVDAYGRKFTLMFGAAPMIFGWLMISYAQDVLTLFIGRFVTGVALGLAIVAGPVYIVETTPARTRGLFSLSFAVSMAIGVVYSFTIGYLTSWNYLAFYCSFLPALQMVYMFFMPETPAWLVKNNEIDIATETVIFLYGNDHNLLSLAFVSNEDENLNNDKLKLFTEARYRTPFLLCLTLMFYQQFCGINAVIFYTSSILASAKSTIDPNLASIYIGLMQVSTMIISCFVVDRFGRKILLYVSGALMALSMFGFSAYYSIDATYKENYGALPMISLIFFIFSYAIGYGPVPWLLMGELIHTKVKGLASGLVTSWSFICMFIITFKFQTVAEVLDSKYIYLFFALISLSSVLFTHFYLPESKGKSLAEIEEYFNRRTQQNTNHDQDN